VGKINGQQLHRQVETKHGLDLHIVVTSLKFEWAINSSFRKRKACL
jgi:hypothetical protein